MHKWYMAYLECLCIDLSNQAWYEIYLSNRFALKNKAGALVRFDREIILAQKMFDAAQSIRNSPITGDSNDMSNNPKFLSFGGDMYVRADQFVRPPIEQTFSAGFNRESSTKVTFADSSWFEVGSRGYKAWPLNERLVKVRVDEDPVKPHDSETVGSIKYKLELDTSEADALLAKFSSAIQSAALGEGLTATIQGEQAIFDPQSFTFVNNGTINISGATVDK